MSPKTLTASTILTTIAEESMGFKFGKPDRPSENSLACILPILRETSQQRQYITMPETEQVIVTDSGSISKVNLKNTSKQNVFVRSGTIFEGKGTQSRVITRSAVLFPGMEIGLDARCVHASHGIRTGAEFKYGGVAPTSVESAMYTSGFQGRDQSAVWNSVRHTTQNMGTMRGVTASGPSARGRQIESSARRSLRAPSRSRSLRSFMDRPEEEIRMGMSDSPVGGAYFGDFVQDVSHVDAFSGDDNLKQNFDAFAKSFDSILSKARLHDNQAGLALITDTGCKTVEVFDLSASWEAIHKDTVKRMGTELLRGPDNSSVFEYKPENAVNAVRKVLALPYKTNKIYEHKPSNGEPSVLIIGLTAPRYVGEVVELDGRVIHLTLLEIASA